jgi:IS5 family transposase
MFSVAYNKTVVLVIATTLCMAVCQGQKSDRRPGKAPNYLSEYAQLYQEDPRKANLEWFKEARFGLFMHYGVYSLLEAGEWVQLRHKPPIPVADYDTLKNKFTANNFDADFITDLAIAAGMKYINITARHHDSFSKKEGAAPKQWEESPGKLAQKDVDARWTKKNNQTYYGYKNHTKVDSESKLISNYLVTDASVHDSQALDQLLEEKDKGEQLYADSAYTGQEEILEKYQVKDQIHEKGARNRPLTDDQKKGNKIKSKTRARVEHIFGFMENSMGSMYFRKVGRKRAETVIGLMNLTYNMLALVCFRRSKALSTVLMPQIVEGILWQS